MTPTCLSEALRLRSSIVALSTRRVPAAEPPVLGLGSAEAILKLKQTAGKRSLDIPGLFVEGSSPGGGRRGTARYSRGC